MTVPFYIFYLPPRRKNFLFTFFTFRHGGRIFLSHFLYPAVAEEQFFYVFYLPPRRKNVPFLFYYFPPWRKSILFYFTIIHHGRRVFWPQSAHTCEVSSGVDAQEDEQ